MLPIRRTMVRFAASLAITGLGLLLAIQAQASGASVQSGAPDAAAAEIAAAPDAQEEAEEPRGGAREAKAEDEKAEEEQAEEEQAKEFLLGKRAARRWWRGRVSLGALSDSNPRLVSDRLAEALALGEIDPEAAAASDVGSELRLRLDFDPRSKTVDEPAAWNRGVAVEGRQTTYQDVEALDLTWVRGIASLARGATPLRTVQGPLSSVRVPAGLTRRTWVLQAGVGHLLLDGSSYLTVVEAGVSLHRRTSPRFATRLDLHLKDEEFTTEPAVGRRSGLEARLSISEIFLLGREDRYLRLEQFGGRRGGGDPWKRSLLGAGFDLVYPIDRNWTYRLTGSVRFDSFDEKASDLFNPELDLFDPRLDLVPRPTAQAAKRDDTTTWAAMAIARRLGPVDLVARLEYTERDSNLVSEPLAADLDYGRLVSSLGVAWSF